MADDLEIQDQQNQDQDQDQNQDGGPHLPKGYIAIQKSNSSLPPLPSGYEPISSQKKNSTGNGGNGSVKNSQSTLQSQSPSGSNYNFDINSLVGKPQNGIGMPSNRAESTRVVQPLQSAYKGDVVLPAMKSKAVQNMTLNNLQKQGKPALVGSNDYNNEKLNVENNIQNQDWMPPSLLTGASQESIKANAINDFSSANNEKPEDIQQKLNEGKYIMDEGKVKEVGGFADNFSQGVRNWVNNIGLGLNVSAAQSRGNNNEMQYYLNEFNRNKKYDRETGAVDGMGKAGALLGGLVPYAAASAIMPYSDIPLMGMSNLGANHQQIWNDPTLTTDQKVSAINNTSNDAMMIGMAQGAAFHSIGGEGKPTANSLLSKYIPTSGVKYKFAQNLYNSFGDLLKTAPSDVAKAASVGAGTEALNDLSKNKEGIKVDFSNIPQSALEMGTLDLLMKVPKVLTSAYSTLKEAVNTGYDKVNPQWYNSYSKQAQDGLNAIVSAPEKIYTEAVSQLDKSSDPAALDAKTKIQTFRGYFNSLPSDLSDEAKGKALHILQLKTEAISEANNTTDSGIKGMYETRAKAYDGLLTKLVENGNIDTKKEPLLLPRFAASTPQKQDNPTFVQDAANKGVTVQMPNEVAKQQEGSITTITPKEVAPETKAKISVQLPKQESNNELPTVTIGGNKDINSQTKTEPNGKVTETNVPETKGSQKVEQLAPDNKGASLPSNEGAGKFKPITLAGTEIGEHGQDIRTAEDKEGGIKDSKLTDKGVGQAEDLGKYVAEKDKNLIISSEVERAKQTANIAADKANKSLGIKKDTPMYEKNGVKTASDKVYNTWNIGDYDGKPKGSFHEKYYTDNPDEKTPNGESFNDFKGRMEKAYVKTESMPKTTQVVAHSKVLRAFQSLEDSNPERKKGDPIKWTDDTTKQFLKLGEEEKAKNEAEKNKVQQPTEVKGNTNTKTIEAVQPTTEIKEPQKINQDALQIGSTEKDVPRTGTTGENITDNSTGIRPSKQGDEPTAESGTKPNDTGEPPTGKKEESSLGEKEPTNKISKAGLKADYDFSKKFAVKGDQQIADETTHTLNERAFSNGISIEKQAANEVSAMKNKTGAASEHDIMTAAYHLRNLDKQIDERSTLGKDITDLTKQRNEALDTLRQLGNNAGRNLGLFGSVYKVVEDGKLEVTRNNLKRSLGVDNIPTTQAELDVSDLSKSDKNKVTPYVKAIEELNKTLADIKTKSTKTIADIHSKEVKDYIDKEVARLAKDNKSNTPSLRTKKSQQLKDIAASIRTGNEMDKFLKGAGGVIQKSGIDIDYKELAAQALEYIAKGVEKSEDVAKLIKEAARKYKGKFDETELAKDLTAIIGRISLPDKDEVIGKIKAMADAENSKGITSDMVKHGLIKDVVNEFIHSDTPYDKVIQEATKELQKHLPQTDEKQVEDALLKKGEFKQQTKKQVETEATEKTAKVKRLATTESNIRALEAADNIHAIIDNDELSNKEKKTQIEASKSDYEKDADKRLKDLQDQQKEAKKALEVKPEIPKKVLSDAEKINNKNAADAEKLKQKLDDIQTKIDLVKSERRVFDNALKNKKTTNEQLVAAKKELSNAYSEAGIRQESGSKTEIKIAQDADAAIKEIKDSDLDEETKKEHIASIEKGRDEQIKNTKQGVLSNLRDSINDHVADLTSKENDAIANGDTKTKEAIENVKEALQNLSKKLDPNTENLKDQIDKADQDLSAIIKENEKTPFEQDLKAIRDQYHENWQKTSDELSKQRLMDAAIRSEKESYRKINGMQYTEIPTTPYDVQTNEALAAQRALSDKAWSKLSSLSIRAKEQQQNKGVIPTWLIARRDFMISSLTAIQKVLESGISKPLIDPFIKQTMGRISGYVTGVRPTELHRLGGTYRQLKNEASADRFMKNMNTAYVDALVNYDKVKSNYEEDSPELTKARNKVLDAEIDHNAALAYLFINAGSHIDIAQVMLKGATDLDAATGKYRQRTAADIKSKLESTRFWLESVNRTHAAVKSFSNRQSILDHYTENLQMTQKKEGTISDESRQRDWNAAVISGEEGRFGEKTDLSKGIGRMKNSNNSVVRNTANFNFPVAKISINITKQGIDMALPFELIGKTIKTISQGIKANTADGIEFNNFKDKFQEGVKKGFDQLPLEQKKYINTLMYRGLFGVAQYALIGYGLSSGWIKYGQMYDDKDPYHKGAIKGSDGKILKYGEWEFGGHRAPKLLNMAINHSPYSLPASLATVTYQQLHAKDKKGLQVHHAFTKDINEIYERLPFATLVGVVQALTGDEYKLQRLIANEVPSFKNVAEYFDKDKNGETRPVQIKGKTFLETTGNMIKSQEPGVRNSMKGKGRGSSGGGGATVAF